ncbi:hypothetical protein QVD99_001332 [Batrachochytrium dendrobatidis]|nr:hypothetical protein QVD99_001332 [Batrachochytrium dendrobatidis]
MLQSSFKFISGHCRSCYVSFTCYNSMRNTLHSSKDFSAIAIKLPLIHYCTLQIKCLYSSAITQSTEDLLQHGQDSPVSNDNLDTVKPQTVSKPTIRFQVPWLQLSQLKPISINMNAIETAATEATSDESDTWEWMKQHTQATAVAVNPPSENKGVTSHSINGLHKESSAVFPKLVQLDNGWIDSTRNAPTVEQTPQNTLKIPLKSDKHSTSTIQSETLENACISSPAWDFENEHEIMQRFKKSSEQLYPIFHIHQNSKKKRSRSKPKNEVRENPLLDSDAWKSIVKTLELPYSDSKDEIVLPPAKTKRTRKTKIDPLISTSSETDTIFSCSASQSFKSNHDFVSLDAEDTPCIDSQVCSASLVENVKQSTIAWKVSKSSRLKQAKSSVSTSPSSKASIVLKEAKKNNSMPILNIKKIVAALGSYGMKSSINPTSKTISETSMPILDTKKIIAALGSHDMKSSIKPTSKTIFKTSMPILDTKKIIAALGSHDMKSSIKPTSKTISETSMPILDTKKIAAALESHDMKSSINPASRIVHASIRRSKLYRRRIPNIKTIV